MSKEEFDNYRFSINTEVSLDNSGWMGVTEVDFGKRKIGTTQGFYLNYNEFRGIRQKGSK